MDTVLHIAQYFLGIQFFIFGINGFFRFLPIPPASPRLDRFVQAAEETKYLMPTVKLVEIIGGALCLFPQFVLMGWLLLAPIVVNVVGLHLFLNTKKSWIILLQVFVPFLLMAVGIRDKITLLWS